jgi:hypothetical protein
MRILLDTCSLNAIPIDKDKLKSLNSLLTPKSAQFCLLHVTFNERYKKEDIYANLKDLGKHYTDNGLIIHVNLSEIYLKGITIKGTARKASDFQMQLFKELENLVKDCESSNKKDVNIKRDTIIGVSSLNYDVFITSDKCLKVSLDYLIQKNIKKLKEKGTIPKTAYRKPEYQEIVDEIKLQLEKWTGGEGRSADPPRLDNNMTIPNH